MPITSEDAKNWITAASILVGGLWVLYEWNTLFPKTEAEVAVTAAALRARTTGNLTVAITPMPDGEEPVTPEGDFFFDVCGRPDVTRVQVSFQTRLYLGLSSSAPIPVRVEVTDFLLAEVTESWPGIASGERVPAFVADTLGEAEIVPLPPEAFVGALNWTHVEPQGRSGLAVIGSVALPFSCSYGGSDYTPAEFAFGLRTTIRSVDLNGALGEPVDRYFYQICRVNAVGQNTCSPTPEEPAGGGASSGGFQIMAQ